MLDFFEELREERKLDEGLQLLKVITDSSIRSRMQAVLALHLSGIDDKLPVFDTMVFSLLSIDAAVRRRGQTTATPSV